MTLVTAVGADHFCLIVGAWSTIEPWAPASSSPLTALILETVGDGGFRAGEGCNETGLAENHSSSWVWWACGRKKSHGKARIKSVRPWTNLLTPELSFLTYEVKTLDGPTHLWRFVILNLPLLRSWQWMSLNYSSWQAVRRLSFISLHAGHPGPEVNWPLHKQIPEKW